MLRRDFLRTTAAALGAAALPRIAHADTSRRVVVLIDLTGGNDGLNTVAPFADPGYRRARPRLGLSADAVLRLDERVGLHPALQPLMPIWQAGELGIVEGVGYPEPDRSHFASRAWWASGRPGETGRGWVSAALPRAGTRTVDAVVLGGDPDLCTGGVRATVLARPDRLLRRLPDAPPTTESPNPTLRHLLRTADAVHEMGTRLRKDLARVPAPSGFPGNPLGKQLALAARLIEANSPAALYAANLGGFDTHAGQANRHRRLLTQLGEALAAFRGRMQSIGAWDRVLVMTTSEFGRRVAENQSGGTDHGTAGAHFILGGRVRGGLLGAPPSLTDLDGGDLRHSTDFRRLHATAAAWWGAPEGAHRALPCLRPA
jgi:uncharacterized protein (DUF1501 family)